MDREENSSVLLWLFAVVEGLIILGLVFSGGCLDLIDEKESIPIESELEPVVKVSSIDYRTAPHTLPYEDTHRRFAENYTGANLTVELRNDLMDKMVEKAEDLGENGTILRYCIEEKYHDMDERPIRIPTYAEKCFWGTNETWAIAFNRCNGWEDGIGHYDLYFFSIEDIEHIYVTGCYGCNSTHAPIIHSDHCD
jgi:hypothetical protein